MHLGGRLVICLDRQRLEDSGQKLRTNCSVTVVGQLDPARNSVAVMAAITTSSPSPNWPESVVRARSEAISIPVSRITRRANAARPSSQRLER